MNPTVSVYGVGAFALTMVPSECFMVDFQSMVASATLPDHILDDICVKFKLLPNARMVCITNACPNVALSCRPMKHVEKIKANLCFLILVGATKPEDIDITLVYCDQRINARILLTIYSFGQRNWIYQSHALHSTMQG